MVATQTTNNNSIRSILKKEKLIGSNFLDWYRNLRIVLRNEQKLHHLEEALPEAPPATATAAVRNAYTCRAFHAYKEEEGQSVSTYVLMMKAYLDQMKRLGYPMPLVRRVDLILTSLLKDYDQFMQNYNMHGMGKTIPELHAMLKLAEKSIPKKAPTVLAIRQAQNPPTCEKGHPAKDTECHHCHKTRHWKKNCPLYLVELEKNKASTSGTSGYRKLNKGSLDLYVGNGHSAAIEAIGSFELILPSGMILVFDNCHFSPFITRGIVSLSRLWDKGFHHKFMYNGAISVSKDNIFYFNAFPRDGIFEIDMHDHISNERSIYTCSNKKSKHNLYSTFLWHCRLGHINKKRIAKPQHDGLLESIDDESFDVCVSCICGKMARKPFTHVSERVDDLLRIIHSDVCGPFRTTSREGANYYVTLTDDFSRYGYGYALGFAAHVLNMVLTKKVDKTPYEMWHKKVLDLSYMKVWGCEYLVKRDTPNKLESRSIKCIFIGYPKETMGYYFYYPPENKISRYPKETTGYYFYYPHDLSSASSYDTQRKQWLFKKKTDMDGNIHTYKAHLVAKGFTQTYRVDYEETFSPVADIKTIRILIAIAAYYDYKIWKMDVKTAFLNGRLNEDVYMVQPERFVNPKHPRRVCKL
ncbi:retrotransposon protein, putative, ty1-copia subclass [Tanacetum coccineum]